jgi:hypothetical protein
VIGGDLTPECATAVRAVLEALGKEAGPEDDRTEGQRFHDALQLACALLPRARLRSAAHPARRPPARATSMLKCGQGENVRWWSDDQRWDNRDHRKRGDQHGNRGGGVRGHGSRADRNSARAVP